MAYLQRPVPVEIVGPSSSLDLWTLIGTWGTLALVGGILYYEYLMYQKQR